VGTRPEWLKINLFKQELKSSKIKFYTLFTGHIVILVDCGFIPDFTLKLKKMLQSIDWTESCLI